MSWSTRGLLGVPSNHDNRHASCTDLLSITVGGCDTAQRTERIHHLSEVGQRQPACLVTLDIMVQSDSAAASSAWGFRLARSVHGCAGRALDFSAVWFLANALLYIAVLAVVVGVEIRLGHPTFGLSGVATGLLVALPELPVLMIIPSLVVIAVSWHNRVKPSWKFRTVTFLFLLLPCLWSEDLTGFAIKAAVQAVFASVMLRSRTYE